MRVFLPPFVALSLLATVSAQVQIETFDGPNLPAGWTVRSGSWSITNGRISQSVFAHQYMTLDGVQLRDCVVDVDAYWMTNAIQFGGLTLRHAGTATEDCLLGKIQANSATPAGFDTLWSYERPGGVLNKLGITPPITKARVRLIAVGAEAWLMADTNQTGVFDQIVGPRTNAAHAGAGYLGIAASGPVQLDNFAYFDAVLMDTGSPPKIGTTYGMKLTTQATTVTPFLCAAALTNGGTTNGNIGGIPIGTRRIPLGVDALLNFSLSVGGALGLVGLTDAQGVGSPTFVIPALPALIGFAVEVAGFTIDGAQPFGIGNISNNHRFVIQP